MNDLLGQSNYDYALLTQTAPDHIHIVTFQASADRELYLARNSTDESPEVILEVLDGRDHVRQCLESHAGVGSRAIVNKDSYTVMPFDE